MFTNNFALYGVKVFAGIGQGILYFPLWWYTRGLLNAVSAQIKFIKDCQKSLALFVWIRNIFTPMYGQRDWQGVLISIFMRIVQIFFRSIIMIICILIAISLLLVWVFLPILALYQVFFQLY